MEDATQWLEWLSGTTDARTLVALAVVVLGAVEAAKRIVARFDAAFKDWWLAGAGLGAGLGLAFIDLSLGGAAAGLVVGVLATGGFEYLRGAGLLLGAKPRP